MLYVGPSRLRTPALTIVSVAIVFAVYGTLLWAAGLFRFDGSEAKAKIVSATLALTAAFVTAVLSLVGILLRHSIEERAEARLQVETERNDMLRAEAERRLQLEASIRAIDLLKSTSSDTALPSQRTAVLFTLVSLRQFALVATLVRTWLQTDDIESTTATDILNHILLHGDALSQQWATSALSEFAAKLVLPDCFLGPWTTLPAYTRDWAPVIIARIFVSKPLSYRREEGELCVGMLAALAYGWQTEPDERIKGDIGAILAALLRALPELMHQISTPAGIVDLRAVWRDIHDVMPNSKGALTTALSILKWAESAA